MAASSSKLTLVKLDRSGEHRDDVPATPLARPEGKFVFVPTLAKPPRERGRNDDNDIYWQGDEQIAQPLTNVVFRKGKGQLTGMDLPPALSLVPTLGHTFRFQSTSNSLTLVSAGNFLGSLGTIGTITNSSVSTIATSFRIRSIKIWPASGGTCFVEWAASSGYTKDELKDASLPTGVTVSKSLKFIPPRNSFAALWTNSTVSSTGLFSIFAPTGAIIDVAVSYTNAGVFEPFPITVAAAVIGNVYYLALDGPTTNHFPPSGLPTTH